MRNNIVDLFWVSLMSNLKFLLLTAMGAILALQRLNILGPEATKHINVVSFYVFNPALYLSNLAETITRKSIAMLWFMPLNILISYVVGSILGWMLLKIVQVPHSLRGLVFGCCVSGNIGTLMLVLVTSICEEKGNPFGDSNVCKDNALAYASLSFAIGGIYFWTYVYRIVRIAPTKICNIHSDDDPPPTPPLPSSSPPSSHPITITTTTTQTESKVRKLVGDISLAIKDVAAKYLNLKSLLTPSNMAVIVGLTIGITPLLRKTLVGPSAPLHILHDTASLLGGAFIPTITLITGANLLKGIGNKSELKYSVAVLIGVIRFVIMPIIGVAVVKGGVRLGMIPSHQPLYHLVLLLQHSVPPVINMTTIVQLNGVGEKECSFILLATYLAAPAALTLWSTFFMWLVLGQHL